MPWSVAAAVGAAAVGSAVSGAMAPSPSGGSGGSGSYYVPTGLASTDQGWQGLQNSNIDTYYNNAQPYNAVAQQSAGAGLNAYNQYGGAYQNAANGAGVGYGNLVGIMNNQANLDFNTQNSLLGAGQQVYQNALDPQSALYNRSAQQLQDQTGATNSMYGLGSSAAGAGVANQAMSNFNIDWNAQQLQNQIAGLQAYGQAANQAGQYGTAGQNAAASAPGYQLQAGAVPYQTAQSIAATPGQIAGQYGSYLNQNVYGPAQSIQSQAIPYMNNGQGAQSLPYQNAYNNAQATGGAIGSAVSGLGNSVQNTNAYQNFVNPAGGSFSGGDFSNAFSSSPYYSGGGNSYGFTM
ncbi:hypothetical protein [Paraburkholderia sp. D1E]|uniref:hypothetical protein n=1 Tax=Paraburkholderia sp. D1E TaxID=3461398 RepID=UPI0040452FA0